MLSPQRKIVDTPSGGQISYMESGHNGNDKTVLFLHGIMGNARSFRRQLEDLQHQYHVVAWDAPGYGETSVLDNKEPSKIMESYASVVCNLLDALKIERVHAVVGHSMGGIVAQAFAGLYPNRVERLVISSSRFGDGMSPDSPLAEKWTERLLDLQRLTPPEFGVARAKGMLPREQDGGFVKDAVRNEVASIASEVTASGLENGCKLLHAADTRKFCESFTTTLPVLVVIGDLDRVIPPDKSKEVADMISSCQIVRMQGVAHAAYLEDPEAYNDALIKFMGQQRE